MSPADLPPHIPVQPGERRPTDAPPPTGFALFAYGFRPFFFAAGIYACIVGVVWIGLFDHVFSFPGDAQGAVWSALWHGHEMIFGFMLAAIAGFFLTVIPNWTGRASARSGVLISLSAIWLLGRVAFTWANLLPAWWVAALDLAFIPALLVVVAPPLLARQHRRQFIFVPILLALLLGNVIVHLGMNDILSVTPQDGLRLSLDAIILLLAVMGGRVVPSFTSSALGHSADAPVITRRPWLERIIIPATALPIVLDVLQIFLNDPVLTDPLQSATHMWWIVVGVMHAIRLTGWQSWHTRTRPILWVLHLGYGWMAVGLVAMGVAGVSPQWVSPMTALHALAIGGAATLIIAIMSRASLGHTGRALQAARPTVAAYGLISLAAILRIGAEYVNGDAQTWMITAAGSVWVLAFLLFAVIYAPILSRPRIDGRPG